MSQRVSLLSTAALILAVAPSARAQGEPFVVRVEYEAPAGCPTEDAFLHQVSQRARHTRFADAGEPARAFRAVITQESANRFSARLDFVDTDFRIVSREVDGNSCSEVAEALVLITALAIDPLLSEPKPQPPAHEPPVPPSSPNDRSGETRPDSTVTTTNLVAPEALAWNPPSAHRLQWSLGVSAGAVSDAAPRWAPSFSAFFGANSWNLQSSLRVDVSYAESTTSTTDAPLARYRLLVGALEGCPWSTAVANGLRIWPCAALEAGAFNARGLPSSRLPSPESTTNLWLAADLGLRAGIELGRRLQLEINGRMRFPMIRNSYSFSNPLIEAHKVPALGGAVFVGLAVFFGGQ